MPLTNRAKYKGEKQSRDTNTTLLTQSAPVLVLLSPDAPSLLPVFLPLQKLLQSYPELVSDARELL